jgi:hypothetical protein
LDLRKQEIKRDKHCGCQGALAKKSIAGQRFGMLVAVRRVARDVASGVKSKWECVCDCGVTKLVGRSDLLKTRSCGCMRGKFFTASNQKLRSKHTRLYANWATMKERCTNPKSVSYPNYGGRGIKVHPDWALKGNEGFANFLRDVGEPPTAKHSIDRIDNNGNYEPGNVRWAERKTQARNTRVNCNITINDETCTLAEWSERSGLKRETISRRLRLGWPSDRLLAASNRQVNSNG